MSTIRVFEVTSDVVESASESNVGFWFMFALYVLGIILAKGFISTVSAILFPPWSWYVVLESFFSWIGVLETCSC